LWCRDVEVDEAVWAQRVRANKNHGARNRRPSSLSLRKEAEIADLKVAGVQRIGRLTEKEFLVTGLALYAGEGSKTDGAVKFANSDPRMMLFFVSWLRHFYSVDESRLRMRLYLHEGLDIDPVTAFWSDLTSIPESQFTKPYRAVADPSIRRSKHPMGCPSVSYCCSTSHRAIMGQIDALLICQASIPG
jgi:hypothetical protein